MAKFLVVWRINASRLPVSPQERAGLYAKLTGLVKESMRVGKLKDWGIEPSGSGGYAIFEGTEVEANIEVSKYIPYVSFEVRPVLTVEQTEEVLKALSQIKPQ